MSIRAPRTAGGGGVTPIAPRPPAPKPAPPRRTAAAKLVSGLSSPQQSTQQKSARALRLQPSGSPAAKDVRNLSSPQQSTQQQAARNLLSSSQSSQLPPPPGGVRSQVPAPGGGGGSSRRGGGGGGPSSIADFDWFKSDPFFRTAAGGAQSDLVDQLAQLLFEQGQAYQGIDNARRQWGTSRDRSSLDLGENFAARGLNQSGLYMRGLQDMLKDYEESAGQIDQSESSIGQQLGQRNSMADLMAAEETMRAEGARGMGEGPLRREMAAEEGGGMGGGPLRREALFDDNYNALADVYGRLGQRGVQSGNRYQSMLNQMRAQSAGRSNDRIINTLGW